MNITPPVGMSPTSISPDGVTPIPSILQQRGRSEPAALGSALRSRHGALGSLLGALDGASTTAGGGPAGCSCAQAAKGAASVKKGGAKQAAAQKVEPAAKDAGRREAPPAKAKAKATAKPAPESAKRGVAPDGFKLEHPLRGARLTSHYGEVASIRGGRPHSGTDLAKPAGSPIRSAAPGKVLRVGYEGRGLGNYVVIDHGDGWTTKYGHMASKSPLRKGDVVDAGTAVGKVGSTGNSTGPHLHFMVVKDGRNQNPEQFLNGKRRL